MKLISRIFSRPLKLKYAESLAEDVNPPHIAAVQQSEKEGIKEIRRLVQESPKEKAWAYLPDGLWIQASKKPKNGIIEADTKTLKKLMKENDEILHYHFHPNNSPEIETVIKELSKANPEDLSNLKEALTICDAMPSKEDIYFMIEISKKFYKRHPKGKMLHKACSLHGIVEYSLTEEGKGLFKKMGKGTVAQVARIIHSKLQGPNPEKEPINIINEYCRMLSNDLFNIRFTQYE
ncbi:MAG: hypothetical protein ABIB71_07310 [Candidatus Woesearchaeota archaeon]